jgi:AMIN domain
MARGEDSCLPANELKLDPAMGPKPAWKFPARHRVVASAGAVILLALTAAGAIAEPDKSHSPSAATSPAPGSAVAPTVRDVKLEQSGSTTQVVITGNGPLRCHTMHLTNPERLVLDFAGTHLAVSEKSVASSLDPIVEIRMSQFSPEITRVVIDLSRPSTYEMETHGNEVSVSFAGSKPAPESPVRPKPATDALVPATSVLSTSNQPTSSDSTTPAESTSSRPDTVLAEQSAAGAGTNGGAQGQQGAQQAPSSGKGPFASQQPQPAGANKPGANSRKSGAVDTRWRTYDLEGVPQYGYNLLDTYNQNRIKGDFPLEGKWFGEADIFQTYVLKERRNLDYTNALPGEKFVSHNNFQDENGIFGFEIRHNDDRFFPSDFRIHIDGSADWKSDINAFNTTAQGHAQVFDAFSDIQLHNFGNVNFNQVFLRGGIQAFKSDFHGLIFNDSGLGGRIFGNALSNRVRYDFVMLKLFQRDAVSGFFDFSKPSQHTVLISRFTWEDFLVTGWNSEWSVHWNHDPRKINQSDSNQLNLDTYYIGTTLNGNLGRFIFNPAIYGVFGTADHLVDGDRVQHDVRAWTGVLDLEYPMDEWKFRVGYVYESGERGGSNSRTDTAFDAISDAVTLFGGPFSYWVGEDIKYSKGDFTRANSFDPSLRGTNNQSNYVNPGLQLVNGGFDTTITPRVAVSFNVNWLYFNNIGTYNTNNIVNGVPTTTTINHHNAGIEENIFIRWKPFLRQRNDFFIVDTGFSVLQPLAGIKDAFGSSRPVYTFQIVPRVVF